MNYKCITAVILVRDCIAAKNILEWFKSCTWNDEANERRTLILYMI
jgi:hypothetical protein